MSHKVLGIIPARGGSKGIPNKNIKDMCGKPLISYIIEAAKDSKLLDRVIVSTDSEKIAKIAENYGAEIPFIRPAHLATDEISLIPVIKHAMEYLDNESYHADIVVSLQPTSPALEGEDIDRAIEKMMAKDCDSVVTLKNVENHPFWVKKFIGDRVLSFNEQSNEKYLQRQNLPPAYIFDGAIFVRKRENLLHWNGNDFGLGNDIRGIVLNPEKSIHIDDSIDWKIAEAVISSGLIT